MRGRRYAVQEVIRRRRRSDWTPGILEVQIGVRRAMGRFAFGYEWFVDCNIPRMGHPLQGRHPVAKGRTWTRRGAWRAARHVVYNTDCLPMAVKRKESK